MKRLFAASFFFVLLFPGPFGDINAELVGKNLFFEANRLYFDKKYNEALKAYQTILKGLDLNSLFVPKSYGELFYNIGNCYYRLGKNGYAILNYEKAKNFLPRDPDLKYNLHLLKDTLKDKIEQKVNVISMIFFWIESFSLIEFIAAFSVINFFLFFLLTLRLFYKAEWNFYLSVLIIIIWIVCGISTGIKFCRYKFDDRVVILDKEVEVLAGPLHDDTLLFKLHEGTVSFLEKKEKDFSLIRLNDGKRGWLISSSIGSINKLN